MTTKLGWVSALALKIGNSMVDLMELVIILIKASFDSLLNNLFSGPLPRVLQGVII